MAASLSMPPLQRVRPGLQGLHWCPFCGWAVDASRVQRRVGGGGKLNEELMEAVRPGNPRLQPSSILSLPKASGALNGSPHLNTKQIHFC